MKEIFRSQLVKVSVLHYVVDQEESQREREKRNLMLFHYRSLISTKIEYLGAHLTLFAHVNRGSQHE